MEKHTPVDLVTLESSSGPASTHAPGAPGSDITTAAAVVDEKVQDLGQNLELDSTPPPRITKRSRFASAWRLLMNRASKVVNPSRRKRRDGSTDSGLHGSEDGDDSDNEDSAPEPLEGKSLYIFDVDSPIRNKLHRILSHTLADVFMFILFIVNLVFLILKIDSPPGKDTVWGGHWTDYGLLAIFIIYTFEIAARIIVSGLILFPREGERFRRLFMPTAGAHSMPTNIEPILEIKPQHPFLRHSFNRMDMVALVCYWIDFFLMMGRVEGVYIFKALAALRTLRLINMTLQKWTPLHSLKKSIPLLLNIALSIAFLFLLFSIIGVVAFKGSYTRRCVLATDETVVLEEQFCGSYYKEVGSREKLSYITLEGVQSPTSPKGYTCAYGYICKDTGEYFENDLSFDHIGVAMVQVYILMTAQTWTDIMYKIMDAEHGASSIYFILVILIMNFWILNLFVAVIIESESMSDDDEEDTKNALESTDVDEARDGAETRFKKEQLRKMEFFWVLAIIADLVFQCQPQYKSRTGDILSYENAELWFTVLFLVDIGIRFTVWPAHPKFFHSPKNNFDLFLAVVTTIIQIPAIRYSDTYTYLSVFQVMRIYRPIIYIQSLKDLIQRVVGRWQSMLGLLFFIAMFLVVAAVMAGLLFREIVSQDNSMNFSDFYVSYLGMYQIFSGENWTDILYNVMEVNMPWHQIFVGTVFVIAFYSFANFVLLNMIVAIISDNFGRESDVEKHNEQIKGYAATRLLHDEKERLLVSDLHTYLQQHKEPVGVHSYPPEQVNTVSQELTCEFFFDDTELFHDTFKGQDKGSKKKTVFRHRPGCPGHALPKNTDDGGLWEWFRHRSLLVFGPHNKIRQFCQKFVTPGKGYRVDGLKDDRRWSRIFNSFIAMAILGSVIVAMVTTPVWRFRLDQDDSAYRQSVIAVTDYVFTAIFVGEFILRIIADGFILTPDAYLRSLWNQVDFIVLLAMCARVIWRLMGWSRTSLFFRSLRALRAIRLITLSTYIKDTFHAVLIAGFPQLLDATMLCMALLVPFAIYGMRLFSGEFFKCNDEGESIMGLNDCMGTFQHKDFNITIPRYWANPPDYSFNNFWASFLLLLEIVSQDGWVDVMETARNSAGVGMQPRQDASRYNGIFFVVFNMAGGYFVTSLFVAIVIETYSRRTGTAFMSADQLRWKNLRQFLRGIRISKSLRTAPEDPIKAFYYRLVSHKNGWFAWLLTGVTILIGITLATENLHHGNGEMVKCWFTFFFLLFYVFEIYANLRGIGWHAYRVKKWNLYNGGMSILALVATLLRLGGLDYQVLVQVQKLILTGILMRLVPRSESLNRLVMTMFASLDHILKLLAAWLIVFAVYGIMFMEVFGLTSYGEGETGRANFRDIGSTLLMMVRMSTGEGWSGLMHDYAKEKPLCVKSSNYLLTDCGSTPLAYTLFISFNIISMYIFTNMFVAEVMQKFSYVYPTAPITRNDTRSFKKAWDEVDTEHTGYIHKQDLEKFLNRLRGKFDVRIYRVQEAVDKVRAMLDPNYIRDEDLNEKHNPITTGAISTAKKIGHFIRRVQKLMGHNRSTKDDDGIKIIKPHIDINDDDLDTFNYAVGKPDKAEVIQQRRRIYTFLHAELDLILSNKKFSDEKVASSIENGSSVDKEKGVPQSSISFQRMIMIMARYKLAKDETWFSIEERLRHRQRMEKLHRIVAEDLFTSSMRMVAPRWRFRKYYREVQEIKARIRQTPVHSEIEPLGQPGSSSSKASTSGSSGAIATHEEPIDQDLAHELILGARLIWKKRILDGEMAFNGRIPVPTDGTSTRFAILASPPRYSPDGASAIGPGSSNVEAPQQGP